MQVIKSAVDCGDGVSIEREHPSTASRSMPAYGALNSSFKAQPIDELTGTFDAQMGELRSDHLTFKAQPINELTGEGRPMNVWTNGSATSFEDRTIGDYDANDAVFGVKENIDWTAANGGPGSSYLTAKTASEANAYVDEDVDGFMKLGDIKGELQTTDITRENRFFNELIQGSSVASTNPVLEVGTTAGPGGSTFMTETFEPAAGMDSFGESLNPVLEIGANSGPGGTTFLTGQCDFPTNNIGGSASPGGDTV